MIFFGLRVSLTSKRLAPDDRPLARVGQDGVVRRLGVGCGLEPFPKHESRIFSTPGLALAAQGEGHHGVSELGQDVLAVLDRRALAVEYVADHAQRPPGLVGRLGIGETRQALDGLEVSLVRPGRIVGRDGDVEIGIGVLGVAQPLHAGAEGGAGGHRGGPANLDGFCGPDRWMELRGLCRRRAGESRGKGDRVSGGVRALAVIKANYHWSRPWSPPRCRRHADRPGALWPAKYRFGWSLSITTP